MGQVISFSGGGGGGGAMMMIIVVIAAIAFLWFWRNQQNQQPAAPGAAAAPWVINTPGSPAAPAAPVTTLPPVQGCNCTTNVSCNALCSNVTQFNQCCFGTAAEEEEELPDPNPAICSSQFNGSCNTECGRNGDIDECEECNAVCDSNIAYTGPDVEEEETVLAGAAQPTCPTGYTYSATQNLCVLSTAAPAQPTCPAGYTYNVTHNLCVQTTAAPVYPNTPIPPPLSQANPTKCKNTYNGSCNTECSSQSQSVCNDCMIACGTATAGAAQPGGTSGGGGRTAECSSKYNGSCGTECSSGNNSTCNACKAACGLSANIATVRNVRSARKILNNRLYNALKARRYSPRAEVRVGYRSLRVGNLI